MHVEIFGSFCLIFKEAQGEIVFQKLQNLWVAIVLMSSYILCKILSFQARVAQEVFNTPGLHSFALACYELSIFRTECSSIRNVIAYANETNIVNKDSLIGGTTVMFFLFSPHSLLGRYSLRSSGLFNRIFSN